MQFVDMMKQDIMV
jgi:hypothetical protein